MTTPHNTTMNTNQMNEDCNDCKVSKMNEGGCDCQIIKCAECGEEGRKFNHHLCEDGLLRCDDCNDTWACQQDGYENECDDFNLRNDDEEEENDHICENCGGDLYADENGICAECADPFVL